MKTDKESVSIIKSEWSEDGLVLRQSADLAVDRERISKRESGVTESVTGSRYQRGQSYKCSRVVFEIFSNQSDLQRLRVGCLPSSETVCAEVALDGPESQGKV